MVKHHYPIVLELQRRWIPGALQLDNSLVMLRKTLCARDNRPPEAIGARDAPTSTTLLYHKTEDPA
jgi:hypothetical protein